MAIEQGSYGLVHVEAHSRRFNLLPIYTLLFAGALLVLTVYMSSADGVLPKITIDSDGRPWLGGDRAFFDPDDPHKDVCHKCGGDGFKPNGLPCTSCTMGFVWITTGAFLMVRGLSKLLKKRRKKWK